MRIKIVTKLLIAFITLGSFVCFASSCDNYIPEVSSEIWDNTNALYVDIESEHVVSAFQNWKTVFTDVLEIKTTFITNKELRGAYDIDYESSLRLLLVLNEGGSEKQNAAIELLKDDERVKTVVKVNDVPYESLNTLAFPDDIVHASVGDTISLTVSGYSSMYFPWFSFDSVFPIVLKKYDINKEYTADDFPLSGASKIDAMNFRNANYLELHLETPGYFSAIKAVHAVAQNPNVLAVGLNYLDYPEIEYSDKWFVSDLSIAEIKNLEVNGWDNDGNPIGYYDGAYFSNERIDAEVFLKKKGTVTIIFTQALAHSMGGSATTTIIVE